MAQHLLREGYTAILSILNLVFRACLLFALIYIQTVLTPIEPQIAD